MSTRKPTLQLNERLFAQLTAGRAQTSNTACVLLVFVHAAFETARLGSKGELTFTENWHDLKEKWAKALRTPVDKIDAAVRALSADGLLELSPRTLRILPWKQLVPEEAAAASATNRPDYTGMDAFGRAQGRQMLAHAERFASLRERESLCEKREEELQRRKEHLDKKEKGLAQRERRAAALMAEHSIYEKGERK